MENKRNTHKKKFSKDRIVNEDIDTALINDKLRKIKKRKQKKNFKNIEEFDTLYNRKEDDPIYDKEEESDTPASIKNKFFEIFSSFLSTKEGMARGFSKDDYEGYDTVYEGARSDFDPRNLLIQAIERVYNSVNWVNTWLAKLMVNTIKMKEKDYKKFSKEDGIKTSYNFKNKTKDDNNDVAIIREQIVWLMSVIFAMFAVLNWYFILFYSNSEGIKLSRISRKAILEMTGGDVEEDGNLKPHLIKFIFFVFEFAIFFVEMFNDIFILLVPKIASFFLDGRTNFILLFVGLIFAFKYFAIYFKNFLIGLLSNVTNNSLINLMYAILFIEFFVSVAEGPKIIGNMKVDEDSVRTWLSSLFNPLLFIIMLIIRFMIIMIVSVPVGGLLIGGLFLYYSFFGILHYMGAERYFSTINAVLQHAKMADSKYKTEKYCSSNWFYLLLLKIIQLIKVISNILYMFKYYIAFLVILIVSSGIYGKKLSMSPTIFAGTNFKVFMSTLCNYLTLPIFFSMFTVFRDDKEIAELLSFLKSESNNIFKTNETEAAPVPEVYNEYRTKSKSIFESLNKIIRQGQAQMQQEKEAEKTGGNDNHVDDGIHENDVEEDVEDVEFKDVQGGNLEEENINNFTSFEGEEENIIN